MNLLRQDPGFKIDPGWFSDAVIKEASDNIEKQPEKKSIYQFEIASATAQQGKLSSALDQMALIDDPKLKQTTDFLEERAEIKSLLGFDDAALQDLDRIDRNFLTWKTFWHRSLILERAGKLEQANFNLRKAVSEAQRLNGDNYHDVLLASARQRKITALEPDHTKAARVLSFLDEILRFSKCPTLAETIRLLKLDDRSAEPQQNGVISYRPLSSNSPIKYAIFTPDGHQIRLIFNSTECGITPGVVRNHFNASTEQELWPGAKGGCGAANLTLYSKKCKLGNAEFGFDGAKEPFLYLNSFFICFKSQ